MKGIDVNILRELFDELQVVTTLDDDGDIMLVQEADADFPHNVIVYAMVRNNRLSLVAGAPGFAPDANLLELANEHNLAHILPVAVVRDGQLRMECSFLLDEEVSKEYVVENCIKLPLSAIWQSFVNLGKELN